MISWRTIIFPFYHLLFFSIIYQSRLCDQVLPKDKFELAHSYGFVYSLASPRSRVCDNFSLVFAYFHIYEKLISTIILILRHRDPGIIPLLFSTSTTPPDSFHPNWPVQVRCHDVLLRL